ncbi:MAG TPA: hypothetical protein VFA76_04965 [Terriglobales bacterium]|nr:hypothetical protein [Terriglobales bacterium]
MNKRLLRHCWIAVVILSVPSVAQQVVTIDWITKQPTSPPITVDKSTPVTVTVIRVNDMLYTYSARVAAHARSASDLAPGIVASGGTLNRSPECTDLSSAIKQLDDAFDKPELKPTANNATPPHHIELAATIAAYDAVKDSISQLETKKGACSDAALLGRVKYYEGLKSQWDSAENKSHNFSFSTTLEPLNDYSIFLLEQYNGVTTDACVNKDSSGKSVGVECEVTYKPVSTIVAASGGYLITMLPSRTYERRNVPQSANAVLAVNNGGPVRTAFATLIDIKIPSLRGLDKVCLPDDTTFGCAISLGPAFELGSGNQGATRIGFLAGFSFHLWRYFYATPAVHIGQFSGFPPGFTAAGQTIPATFTGKLDPIHRTTARFALALTLKGWNLLNKNSTSQGQSGTGKASQ